MTLDKQLEDVSNGPSSDWVPSKQHVDEQRRIDWGRMRSGVDLAAKASGFGDCGSECTQQCNQGRDCDCDDDGMRPLNIRGMFGGLAFSLAVWACIALWLYYVAGRK